jgi:hypothetical protein
MGVSMEYRSRVVETSVIFIVPRFRSNRAFQSAEEAAASVSSRSGAASWAIRHVHFQDTIGNYERSKVIVARRDTVAESTALDSGRSFSVVDGPAQSQAVCRR